MNKYPRHASGLAEFAGIIERAESEGLGAPIDEPPAPDSVRGEYPKEPAFFFGCDAVYFQSFCLTLLASIAERSPGLRCHVHLIDASPATVALAAPIALDLSFTHESSGLLHADKQTRWNYYNAMRFVRFAEALEQNPGPLWIADVDALVTQDIRPLLKSQSDVAFRMRHGRSALNEQVSACLVMGTASSREFFHHVSRFIRSQPMLWGIDQLALFSALVAYKPNVELLGPDIAGVDAEEPGAFWFTAGSAKLSLLKDESKYAREFRRAATAYLNLPPSREDSRDLHGPDR